MAWTDNLFRWLGFARFNSSLPTLGEGDVEELQCDQRGRLRVALEASSISLDAAPAEPAARYVSSALERSAQAHSGAGVVREVQVISTSASLRYVHLINKDGAPSPGDQPCYRQLLPAGGAVSITFPGGHSFATGLRVAISASLLTWSDPGADEALFFVEMD